MVSLGGSTQASTAFGEGNIIYGGMMISCTPLRLDIRWEYVIVEIIILDNFVHPLRVETRS
jgi:hypothetical protein